MAQLFYQAITDFIFVSDAPEKADIIMIPGGFFPEAAEYAASLFRSGYAPLVLPSGKYSKLTGYFPGEEESEWAYLSGILKRNGVPEEVILREDQATFTWENAIFSRKVLEEKGICVKKAILCCQAFHARRALTYYQQQFPDVTFLVCPVVTRGISADSWFLSKEKTDVVLGELERCGQQFHCFLPVGRPPGKT